MLINENNIYVLQNVRGFEFNIFIKALRSRYDEAIECINDNIGFTEDLKDFITAEWDNLEPLTLEECFAEENTEKRRVLFSCLGPERLFKNLEPTLLDKQVIKKKRKRWDENNKEYSHEFEDVYELYAIEMDKLGIRETWVRHVHNHETGHFEKDDKVFTVRCWCTTTNREYWLFVPSEIGILKDAIKAIAWTMQIGVDSDNIEEIYRQGDVVIVKTNEEVNFKTTWRGTPATRSLTKEEYLNLIVSET